MLTLAGYQIEEELHRGEKSVVFRGKKDNKPVILKYLNNEYPSNSDLKNFRKEFEILKKFNLQNSVHVESIENYKNSLILIFEDIGASSIAHILKSKKYFEIEEFLQIAIAIARALQELRENQIIHKDIKPHNIIYNPFTKAVKIIDFGSISLLSRENPEINMKNNLEGTLAYISPEQTGRMNCNVDYRTDFYSLGVSLYQMIVGELPFTTLDPSEIVYSHIAINPVPPSEKRKEIPLVISKIILRLMKKSPEERYQTMEGLIYDLEWCLNTVETHSHASLQIGSQDFSSRFKIPEKLYGREKEKRAIFKIFQNVCEGNLGLALVNGFSGIGKTALINEIQKPIIEQKGYFIQGKYDKFKRNIPYRALIYSFQDLIKQVLAQSEIRVSYWKNEIINALGINAKIITDVIPELETLIGEQPIVAELPPVESQNRFNLVFQKFLSVFCKEEHPLVLFLDDLQWADIPSLHLLKSILTGSYRHIFFVCSYRSNEINETHPFAILLEDLKKAEREGVLITLEPLKQEDVNLLVAETLRLETGDCQDIAGVLHTKTNGNPFFINELFTSFYREGLIQFKTGKWDYDIEKISQTSVSENVIDLMISKINKLPEDKIELLKLAACVGNWFRMGVFVGIKENLESEIRVSIENLANDGYFLVGGDEVKFTHDKVLESVYSLVSEEEKSYNHYLIGRRYLDLVDKKEYNLDDIIFTIVNQLNHGILHIKQEDKLKLVELNLLAGNKALASSAYDAACSFLRQGVSLLPLDKWESHYELCLEIYKDLAECEYLSTHFTEADKLFEYILKNIKSVLDKIPIIHIQLRQKASEYKGDEAFQIGFNMLEQLGLKMPDLTKPETTIEMFTTQLDEYEQLLGERTIPSLFDLPTMNDPNILEAISLITNLGDIAIAMKQEMLGLMSIMGVTLSLKYGNTNVSPISYVMWGVINNLAFKNFKSGYELGQLGLKLNQEKFPSDLIFAKVYAFYGWNIHHYKHHTKYDLEIAQKGYEVAMANSDLVYAMYFVIMFLKVAFNIGLSLDEVAEYGKKVQAFTDKYKTIFATMMGNPTIMASLALQGKTESPTSLNSPGYKEEDYIKNFSGFGQSTVYFYLRKFQLCYLFEEYENCLNLLPEVIRYFPHMPAHIAYTEFFFYKALLFLAIAPSTIEEEKKERSDGFTEAYDLLKLWSSHCEDNFLHLHLLVEAEKLRVEGRDTEAMKCYERAIESARKYGYINNAAIANELAAKFYLSRGFENVASVYFYEAHYLFKLWGATAKVKYLEEKYTLSKKQVYGSSTVTSVSSNTFTSDRGRVDNFLDMNTIIKASQTISGEIQLGKLLEKMMKILFENAGAERGFFILLEKGKWLIEAEGNWNTGTIEVLQAKPLEGYSQISAGIANYVVRTKKIVLLSDAVNKGMFVSDEYVKEKQPKSILCYPIINQGNLVGVVYLENNLTTDAFTPDRVEILKVLSSQIAVSVENSLLYANLEEKVEERTRDLNEALIEVRGLKEQQDGDYFLNTLLIEPLGQNNAFSNNITIDFFLKQKKNFAFRMNEYELGGDINISENLELQGNKFIVFLNGDAMGKSIQGAGGVLVLGTVFKSILQRTKSTNYGKTVYPERWIKNAFIEMHKAFEGFDGSMLMSVVFGLIDERTGTMYFMNSEHPDIALYRDGIPSFIDNPNRYTKLGTQGQIGSVFVSVFSLKPDDIIIMGSDGRDEISLGKDIDGNEIINQDENLFLTHIKKADGDLEKIYKEITVTGKLIDDLSLLKIQYKGINQNSKSLEDDLEKLDEYKKQKQYHKFIDFGTKVIAEYPHLTDCLYDLSVALSIVGEMEKSIDFGEKFRLRKPGYLDNLVNLIDSYNSIGKIERAKVILQECLLLEPQEIRVIKWKQELEKK